MVVDFLPKICDFKVFTKDVVLELILADEEEILHRRLLKLVQVVLKLDVNSLLVCEEEAARKRDMIVILLALSFQLLAVLRCSHHTLVAGSVESIPLRRFIVCGTIRLLEGLHYWVTRGCEHRFVLISHYEVRLLFGGPLRRGLASA